MTWRAPEQATLPDFILCGAMKSGTSTLHGILNQHPDVFIPDSELHFFDMDNVVQHPDFTHFENGRWHYPDFASDQDFYWQWYAAKFNAAQQGQLIGEDSTTYLASDQAFKRIALQHKKIKLLVLLRHPTARTYSHYWHMVKMGRAMFSFEDTLRYQPHSLLDRSDYQRQLSSLLAYIPREQLKVVLFEDFLADKKQVMADICVFLNLDFSRLPLDALNLHANQSRIPKFVFAHLLKARLFPPYEPAELLNRLPENELAKLNKNQGDLSRLIHNAYRMLNPLVKKSPVKISPATQDFLDQYFKSRLQGLDQLLGQEILSRWFADQR